MCPTDVWNIAIFSVSFSHSFSQHAPFCAVGIVKFDFFAFKETYEKEM